MAKVCRLCISESEDLTDVTEVRDGFPISLIIMVVLPVRIESNDTLPKKVCDECLQIVLSSYKLRDESLKIDRYLRSLPETEELHEELHEDPEETEMSVEQIDADPEPDETFGALENEEILDEEEPHDKEEFVVYAEFTDEDIGEQTKFFELDPSFRYQVDCQNETKKSAVWKFFGTLLDEHSKVVEDQKDYYFCKICVEQLQNLKPKYKVETIATSVLFTHLQKIHGLMKSEMTQNINISQSHSVPELVSCEICDKGVNSGSFNIHMEIEHQNGALGRACNRNAQHRVNCFKAGKSLAWDYFGALENLDGEQLDAYYFYCRLCVEEEGKLSPKYTKNTSTSILLQHLKNAHIPKTPEELAKRKLPEPIDSNISSKRLKKDDFVCKLCGENLESRKSLNRHLAKDHDKQQPRNFPCHFENCLKSFTMRDTLFKHIRNIHQGTKKPCDRCPAVLSSHMSLRRHIESCHLKLRLFACDSCNLTYTEHKSLKNHIQKVHLGISEKNVPCELCDLMFPNQWSLRRHLLTHTGEKPHKCHVCALSYASKGDLAKHITKVHGGFVYKCEHQDCTAGFRLKSELRDHYKVHYVEETEESDVQCFEIISEEFIE